MEGLGLISDALGIAFSNIISIEHIFYLMLGVLMGLSVGVFPGLGGIAGLSMLLPFLYGMDIVSGLAMMVGLVAVIPTSDTFASVLMGIPGSSSSQATVLDGFPLAKKGQAARALSAAFTSSLFGGLVGALVLTFLVLTARPIILNFKTPELLMLTIFGFSMVGAVSGKNLAKGILAVLVGVLFSTIGEAPAYGTERMSFGNWYLGDGLQLVSVGLGIFAIPEIIELLRQQGSIAKDSGLGAGWLTGMKDWWNNKWLSLRSCIIGVLVGIIPGLGGSVVDWIAYGHSIQSTKDKSNFGKGEIRGIIGPESSNNAKEGGGLVPTLLFGIPGSGSMAIFLGGMILLGIEAGPAMISDQLDTTYTIVWSLALANVFGTGLCILLSTPIAKLTKIRFPLLAPFLFLMVAFASFQAKQSIWDLVVLLLIGVLGIYMKRFGWSRPAFLIGFVLADQAEVYAYQATQFTERIGFGYIFTPIVGIIFVFTVISVFLAIKQSKMLHAHEMDPDSPSARISHIKQIIFTLILTLFALVIFIDSFLIDVLIDRIFPLIISSFGVIFGAYLLITGIIKRTPNSFFHDEEIEVKNENHYGTWQSLSWFLLLVILTAFTGFFIALALFFPLYLHFRAKVSYRKNAILTISACIFILLLAWFLNRDLPSGIIQAYFNLPWPLR